jgi:hypothetical protein
MAGGWRDFLSTWEPGYHTEIDRYCELDDGRVLAVIRYIGRGETSGLDVGKVGEQGATLFHLRAGTAIRLVLCSDTERAFADLGLAGRCGSPAARS